MDLSKNQSFFKPLVSFRCTDKKTAVRRKEEEVEKEMEEEVKGMGRAGLRAA